MIDATLVTIHGFWSSPTTWEGLNKVWRADEELRGLRIHPFGYPSPKRPRLPFSVTRVPDYNDIAQTLSTEYATVLADAPDIAVVTHSQGGLILQRFLAWMVSEGRARELSRIRSAVMLACPNGGSEYLESLRRILGLGRHPQAGSLHVLDRPVEDTQRTVLQRIVNAAVVDDYNCRIPFHVYAGGSDDIVRAASAQAAFPGASTIAGNHFTILDPAAPGNRTAETVKRHMLADINAPRVHPDVVQAPEITGELEPPATDKRTGSARYVVNAYPDASVKLRGPRAMIGESLPPEHVPDHAFRTTRETWNTLELQFTEARALGRESEIAQLNEAWAANQTHVLLLIAPSGVGKTALVNEWLDSFSDPTLERVFAWSFNNRSASEAALIGSEFLQAALEWVGDSIPSRGSGWTRGERLASLLRKEPTLLVLDGLESLIHGDDAGPSTIADPAVSALLIDLAQDNNGLCVVTAQRSIAELADEENVRVLDLEDISYEAGRDILRAAGIKPKGARLEDIASAFGPNALALQLLAAFLLAHPDVNVMKTVVPSVLDGRNERPYARWVLDAWMHEGDLNAADLQLLRLLYIFDRPVKAIELVQIVESKTAELSDQLPAITDIEWHQLINKLRSWRLILPSRPYSSGALDAHPLVRAYFGEFFDQRNDLREAAHKTVADDLRKALGGLQSDKDATTRSILAAYEVVSHIVAAGDFEQAMTIHWEYVRRGRQYWNREYSLLSTDLSIWSEFFRVHWSELRPELGYFGLYRPFIFSEAAWNLFALGRPKEAVEAAKVAFRESVSYKQWLEASGIAENLSGYLLSLGDVEESAHFADEALRHSSNPERNEWLGPWPKPYPRQVQARVMLARVALYKYDLAECAKNMREAEEINKRFYGDSAVRGYGTYIYVDMLLEKAQVSEALDRAEQSLGLPMREDSNELPEVTVGIERIALGRAYADARDFGRALLHLDDGVGRLRQVGRVDVVVLSLLERARVKRLTGEIKMMSESEHDLRYVRRIANRAGLEPLLAMAELEMAELLADQNRQRESETELRRARQLANWTRYEYLLRRCERFTSRLEGRRDGGRAG